MILNRIDFEVMCDSCLSVFILQAIQNFWSNI